jgi:hypothetical protein
VRPGIAVRLRLEKVSILLNKGETNSDRIKLDKITNFKHQITNKSQIPISKSQIRSKKLIV